MGVDRVNRLGEGVVMIMMKAVLTGGRERGTVKRKEMQGSGGW